ncbi:hypothetical protein ACWGLF_44925 [Streptomyces puniciscabiei]
MVQDDVVAGGQLLGEPGAYGVDDGAFALEILVLVIVHAEAAVQVMDSSSTERWTRPRSARVWARTVLPESVMPTSSTANGAVTSR